MMDIRGLQRESAVISLIKNCQKASKLVYSYTDYFFLNTHFILSYLENLGFADEVAKANVELDINKFPRENLFIIQIQNVYYHALFADNQMS